MKKLLLMMLLSTGVSAGDLIFRSGFENTGGSAGDLIFLNGFENTGLVSGTVSGLISTGLEIELTSLALSQTLAINDNGSFVFSLQVPVGDTWNLAVTAQPNNPTQQSCSINPPSGVMPAAGVNNVAVVCGGIASKWDEMNWDQGHWQ